MTKPLHVLVIEDSEDDLHLLLRALRKGEYEPNHTRVETADAMADALENGVDWDIVLADYNLPRFSAPEALKLLKATGRDIPFVIVSGAVGEDKAVAAMREGAADYVMKANLDRLIPVVERELWEAENRANRRRAEEELRNRESQLRAIMDTAADGIFSFNDEGRVVTFNPAAEEMFGYSRSEVLGDPVTRLFDSDESFLPDLEEKGRGQVLGCRKDGTTFPMEIGLGQVAEDGRRLYTCVARDITDRRAAEEALRKARDRAETYLNAAAVIMVACDEDGQIMLLNRQGERLLGYAEEEVLGRDFFDLLVPPVDRRDFRKTFDRLLRGEATRHSRETPILTKDGRTLRIEWWHTRLEPTGGLPSGLLCSGLDVTDRRRMARELVEKRSLARLGEMAAVFAHEVKNPLAGIKGALQVIAGRLSDDNPDRPIIDEILTRIDDLNHRLGDMLLFARPRPPRFVLLQLKTLFRSVVSLLSGDPMLEDVELQVPETDLALRADDGMLKILFQNLILNAAQAMNGTGTIRIEIDRVEGNGCRIGIIDNGPGIPTEARKKLFEPFFTTKSRGTGLGLTLARRIVRAHEGSIAVTCPPQGGTRIDVTLPLAET